MKTLDVLNTDFKSGCWDEMEIRISCFTRFNPLPSRKAINEKCLFNNQNHPDYIVKQWSNNLTIVKIHIVEQKIIVYIFVILM